MFRDIINIKTWECYRVELVDDTIVDITMFNPRLTDNDKYELNYWSRCELASRQLIEVYDVNKRPFSLVTKGYCLLSNDKYKRQFILKLRETK